MYLPFYPIPASRVGCDCNSKKTVKKTKLSNNTLTHNFEAATRLIFVTILVFIERIKEIPHKLAKLHLYLLFKLTVLFSSFPNDAPNKKKMYKNITSNCCRCRAGLGSRKKRIETAPFASLTSVFGLF